MADFFYSALLIFIVVMLFNVIIFVHELGHFLAAKWRGVKVDRFQVWFGKPIWKKEINGVQYGLGWLPFGGFVALPQMAPMESIEGGNRDEEELPKISPLDKIIVAFAGPLFSILLALTGALLVWTVGKPLDAIETTVVGGVVPDGPADKAGIQAGDKILKVNGEPVIWFAGDFEAIRERIMLTEGDSVSFEIERDGKVIDVVSEFEIAETSWFRRRGLPSVGMSGAGPAIVGGLIKGENQSPAERAGLKVGDEVVAVDGVEIFGTLHVSQLLKENEYQESVFTVKRGDETLEMAVKPLLPIAEKGKGFDEPKVGILWDPKAGLSTQLTYPAPVKQIGDSMKAMWITIKSVSSPSSNVGVDQLAGPIGIAKTKFQLLQTDQGWLRVLWFFVFFNVNLAILNMLPFPVLDGGHIVMAVGEMVTGRPVQGRILEVVQTGFALVLISFMLYITTKDIGDSVPNGEEGIGTIRWPEEGG
ncbi:MAG: RIP metalloprotease RseP [Verrucomicrobiaceae bacterium]